MFVVSGSAQNIGTRNRQEDSFVKKNIGDMLLSVLGDGVGGYEMGDQASNAVTQEFVKFIEKNTIKYSSIPYLLQDATYSANAELSRLKQKNFSNMGSTLVAVSLKAGHAWWVSVGDSLLYLWRNGNLHKLNAEHSHYQDLRQKVFLGEISTVQAANDPERDSLTSALMGYQMKHVDVSWFGIDLQKEDILLLASDGLETLSPELIATTLKSSPSPQQTADSLIQKALSIQNPCQDNISVIVLYISALDSPTSAIFKLERTWRTKWLFPILILMTGILLGVISTIALFP